MPSKSISQQRIMGMAWAARTGRLDTSKLEPDFRKKIEKIAKSKNFSDDSLHKMAKTKHRDKKTNKLIPYKIGKGTPENPERKRKPYKKKAVTETFLKTYEQFIFEKEFYAGYLDALKIMEIEDMPSCEEVIESYIANMSPNPGLNKSISGTLPIKYWKNVDKNFNISNKSEDEDEEDYNKDQMTIQQMKAREMFGAYAFAPTFEEFKELRENIQVNPGMNVMGMGPVSSPGNPGGSTEFHSQEIGSGDIPLYRNEDEEEEEEKKRIRKELKSK